MNTYIEFKMALSVWVGRKPAIQNDDSTDYLILPVLILDSLITMNNYQNIRKNQLLIHKTLYSSEFYLLLTFLVMLVFFCGQ